MSKPTDIERVSVGEEAVVAADPPKLMQRLSDALKRLHYSPRTSEAYLAWIRRYIVFHGLRHPKELKRGDIEVFLTHLAVKRKVSGSTQNQALSAILFLYRKVLCEDAAWIEAPERAYRPKRMPVVTHTQADRAAAVWLGPSPDGGIDASSEGHRLCTE